MKKICIQGYEGSFHQEAARSFLGEDIEVIPCDTFRQLVSLAGNRKESDGGVMAIENSIAGSILPNYTLLMKSKLKIVGEVYLHIKQQLMVNPGVQLHDIREVHSHPMALLQCTEYLEKYPHWKLVETEDTALSARHLHQHHSKHAAAIASKLAADMYGLDIVAPNIHTMKQNYTRFLVLERQGAASELEDANKASVNFVTPHSHGSLVKVLTAIADGGINLSKLQSMPIPGTEFRYSFHADMEFDTLQKFEVVCNTLKSMLEEFKILGVYHKGVIRKTV
jgi:prephenate dehydratase